MRRREFITLLGGAAAAWPLAARAQQPAMPVIGFLATGSPAMFWFPVVGFRQGLADAGYIEGRNVAIEFRWQHDQPPRRLWDLADDLVGRRVAVIVASGGVGAALAAKAATSTIPIVVAGGEDPVRYGLAASLSQPSGNVTGMAYGSNELGGKQLDLLLKLVPQANAVAYLVGNQQLETVREQTSAMTAAARSLGRQLIVLECRSSGDVVAAFATLVERRAGALVVSTSPVVFNNRDKVLALAAHHRIPAIYPLPQFTYDGGLMSYYPVGTLRQVATDYVAPILKGVKPADLPIQRPTSFRLVINLKTAKALGLDVPPMLLAIADEVIE